jgi:hypothetical protein
MTGIRTLPRGRSSGHAGDPPPHRLQVCLEGPLHRYHCLGNGLPRLPVSQGTPSRPDTAIAYPGSQLPLQLHPRGPGRPLAHIQGIYPSVHYRGWCSISTTDSRMRSGPAAQTRTWWITFHGSSLVSAQQPEKTTVPPPLRQCSAHHSFYLDNFWILMNYLQRLP